MHTLHNGRIFQQHMQFCTKSLGLANTTIVAKDKHFFCMANFTLRKCITQITAWSRKNPQQTPSIKQFQEWIHQANKEEYCDTHNQEHHAHIGAPISINIPSVPSELESHQLMAYIGGLYHESAHLLYTHQKALHIQYLGPFFATLWHKNSPKWHQVHNALLFINNILEDIRIERMLCKRFVNVRDALVNLQDLILQWEGANDATLWAQGKDEFAVFSCIIRDIGLGYQSTLQDQALYLYRYHFPKIWDIVHNTPIYDTLQKAIHSEDPYMSFFLCFEMLTHLYQLLPEPPECKAPNNASPSAKKTKRTAKKQAPQDSTKKTEKTEKNEKNADNTTNTQQPSSQNPNQDTQDCNQDGNHDCNQSTVPSTDHPQNNEPGKKTALGNSDTTETAVNLWQKIISAHTKERTEILEEIIEQNAQQIQNSLPMNQQPWRPYSTANDAVIKLRNLDYNRQNIKSILHSQKLITVTLQNKLQRIMMGLQQTHITHGTKKGPSLSSKRYVDTFIHMKEGTIPPKPYWNTSTKRDVSIAISLVLDQSSSMHNYLQNVKQGVSVLAQALHNIKANMQIIGFRTKNYEHIGKHMDYNTFHRYESVIIDVFMHFGEQFSSQYGNIDKMVARGCTPTSDGIQYALENIMLQKEHHKIIMVFTDGMPDTHQQPVVNRQCAIAKKLGISIVGVGLGPGTDSVIRQFEHAVYCPTLNTLPQELLQCLTKLILHMA